jgi:ribosomal 50S subunit-associated protein YjgA (DUF615 family)
MRSYIIRSSSGEVRVLTGIGKYLRRRDPECVNQSLEEIAAMEFLNDILDSVPNEIFDILVWRPALQE